MKFLPMVSSMPPSTKQEDKEILLLIERDLPNLQDRVKSIEENIVEIKEANGDLKDQLSEMKISITGLETTLKEFKEFFKSVEWYKDFKNVLIIILLLSVLALSGVKAAESIITKYANLPADVVTTSSSSTSTSSTTSGGN